MMTSKTVTGAGTIAIGDSGTLTMVNGDVAAQTVDFLTGNGLLALQNPLSFVGGVANFAGLDRVDLANTTFTSYSFGAGGRLNVLDGATTVAAIRFVGTFTTSSFHLANDGSGGVLITHS
jgi:hypothetical protein